MTSTARLGLLLTVLALAGCSQGRLEHPSPALDRGPHQGALRPIRGADGFIEVAIEPVRDAPSGSPKFRAAIYFLDKAQTGPLRPIPTAVSMTATWPDAATPTTTDLVIAPVPGDPAGAAKFVAPPADHKGEPGGSVRGRLGDREVTAAL